MSKPRVYIPFTNLQDVYQNPERYPLWYKIFQNHVELWTTYNDANADRIGKFAELYFRGNPTVIPREELSYANNLIEYIQETDLSPYPRAIFVVSITDDEAERLARRYGVLVLSVNTFNDYNIRGLDKQYGKKLDATDIELNVVDWCKALEDYDPGFPLNTVVINDNYAIDKNKVDSSISNLVSVLKRILPQELGIPIEVFIHVWNENGRLTRRLLGRVVDGIQTALSNSKREVKVTVQSHSRKDTHHPRYILLNYVVITSEHGFNAFDKERKRQNWRDNDFKSYPIFFSLYSKGDIELKWSSDYLKHIRQEWEEYPVNSRIRQEEYIRVGHNRNRLIESF